MIILLLSISLTLTLYKLLSLILHPLGPNKSCLFGPDEPNRQLLFGPNRGQARLVFGHIVPNRGARAKGSRKLVERKGKGKGKPGLAKRSRTGGAEAMHLTRGAGEGRWGPRGAGGAGARGGEPMPMGLEQLGPERGVRGRNWIAEAAEGGGRNRLKDYVDRLKLLQHRRHSPRSDFSDSEATAMMTVVAERPTGANQKEPEGASKRTKEGGCRSKWREGEGSNGWLRRWGEGEGRGKRGGGRVG